MHGESYIKDWSQEENISESVVLLGVTGAGKSTILTVAENDPNITVNLNWETDVIIEGHERLSKQSF